MSYLFLLVIAGGLAYFLFRKRRFDAFSLAFFSCCIYYRAALLGKAQLFNHHLELQPKTYGFLLLVVAAPLIGAVVHDELPLPRKRMFGLLQVPTLPLIFAALSVVLFVIAGVASGWSLFDPDKLTILSKFTLWHILWNTAVIIAAVLAVGSRRVVLIALTWSQLLVAFYLGFRFQTVLSVLGALLLFLSERSGDSPREAQVRLGIRHKRLLVGLAVFTVLVIVWKQVYIYVKLGAYEKAYQERLDPGLLADQLAIGGEGGSRVYIIEILLRSDFRVGLGHLSQAAEAVVLNPLRPPEEKTLSNFNSRFQPALFPHVRGGLASSIWLEFWSAGGWPLLLALLGAYAISLHYLSKWLYSTPPVARGLVAAWTPFWTFYIHRNDLTDTASYLGKQFLPLVCLGLAIALFFYLLGGPRGRGHGGHLSRSSAGSFDSTRADAERDSP